MKISDVSAEILGLVNNSNYPLATVYNWIKATLYEIKTSLQGGRWDWLTTDMIRQMDNTNRFLPYPTTGNPATKYVYEIQEPILFSTTQAATTSWAVPTIMWEFEKENALQSYKGDFRLSNTFGIEFNSRWNTTPGSVWLRFYREMTIPTSAASAVDFDLPDEFVWRLMTYGPARFGLIREDDYERLQICKAEFDRAIKEMVVWDSRRRDANGIKMLKNHNINTFGSGPLMPGNFSLK